MLKSPVLAIVNCMVEEPAATGDEPRRRLLSIGQAADLLGVSIGTLRSWADKGMVKTIRLPSGYRRFIPDDIEALRREMGYETEG